MAKAVVNALLGGALVAAGATHGYAADDAAIPPNLRTMFERFLAEQPLPQPLVNVPSIQVGAADRVITRGKQQPVRLASNNDAIQFIIGSSAEAAVFAPGAVMPAPRDDCKLPVSTGAPPSPAGKYFEIGDKMKLVFFENVKDVEKNKWNDGPAGFQQHPELSGDYAVREDGSISIPVLGSFSVLESTTKDLERSLADAFEKALGHKGFATIVSIERPPIYVLGPVKNQGSYSFSPGMTVLHAITLAGGFPGAAGLEPWQKMEQVRETTKRYGSMQSISDLLVRRTVLIAERDNVKPAAPSQLVDLVGPAKAQQMIATEVERRAAIVSARKTRVETANDQVRVAQQEVEMLSGKGRSIQAQEATIAALRQRAEGIQQLYNQGQLNNNMQIESRTRLSDAERVKQDMINQVTQAKTRLVTTQQDLARISVETRGDLENQIQLVADQIASASRESETSEGILGAMRVQFSPVPPNGAGVAYEIVRQTVKGPVSFNGTGMTTLVPGDLVRLVPEGSVDMELKNPDHIVPKSAPNTTPASARSDCK